MVSNSGIQIYTDGGCSHNPGPGGYGVVLLSGSRRRELSGGFRWTTNNRMELLAVIRGLEALKQKSRVSIYSDSRYVIDGMEKGWASAWRNRGWYKDEKRSQKARNPDLWQKFLELCDTHTVSLLWVKGHSGDLENERCDKLTQEARRNNLLEIDAPFEAENPIREKLEISLDKDSKISVKEPGQACRKCGTSVLKRASKGVGKKYSWYLFCPECKTVYFTEEGKN